MYKICDDDGDGNVDFTELLDGIAVLLSGLPEKKLRMFYCMYSHPDASKVVSVKKAWAGGSGSLCNTGLTMFNVYQVRTCAHAAVMCTARALSSWRNRHCRDCPAVGTFRGHCEKMLTVEPEPLAKSACKSASAGFDRTAESHEIS